MKKSFHLALSALLVGIVACQKQNAEPAPAVDSKAAARQIFEQQRPLLPQTKLGNAQDLVKPLPGDFTPLWDQAVELTNAGQTSVTVPITSSVSYNAVYPCQNHDADHHDHHPILVIQKLVVITSADNPKCYIANTIPCQEGDGELTGFIAYHNFDGTLSHIDQFDNGTKVATAQKDDQKLIGEITRAVKLYPNNNSTRITNYLPSAECKICYDASCPAPNYVPRHCSSCFKEYGSCNHGDASQNRCSVCGFIKSPDLTLNQCICPTSGGGGGGGSLKCPVCGYVNCSGHQGFSLCVLCDRYNDGYCLMFNDGRNMEDYVHAKTLLAVFKDRVSRSAIHELQSGCNYVDTDLNTSDNEYVHNLMLFNTNRNDEYNKLRNWFILKVQQHKSNTALSRMGEVLHPILDWYLPISQRVAMLDFYVYQTYEDVVLGPSSMHQVNADILNVYNTIQSLPQSPSVSQAGAIFDNWAESKEML